MSPIDGPVTLDFDGQGGVWAGTPDGVLRFDPKTESFAEFKSKTARTANGGQGSTYGIAGDRDGNVWWTQMAFDTIAKSDVREGTAREWKLPMVKDEYDRTTEADRKFYEGYAPRDIGTPFPWSQGPRRIGIDRNADVLWVAESWGGTLTRVDTRSFAMTTVPLPNPTTDQPYSANVDQNHNVWTPMWTTDRIGKYDPEAKTWTMFDLPTRGTEVRISSMRQLPDGKTEVVFAYPRSSKVAVLTVRSAEEIKALEAQ
jgi:streptogramin lyase